jgi:hypothetical protein
MATFSYNEIQVNKLNELLNLLSISQNSSSFMRRLILQRLIDNGFILHDNKYFVYPNNYRIRNLMIFTNDLYNIYDTCFFPTSAILSEQYDNATTSSYGKLIHVCDPLICWLFKFRLQLFEPIPNYNDEKVKSVVHCIYLLNNHRSRAELFKNEEQKELILNKIEFYKEKLYSIAIEFNIELSENIKLELSRGERIYKILITERQIEEEVSPNIKQVIQNNDLNRYLMEFID